MPRDERKLRLREIERLEERGHTASVIAATARYLADYPEHGFMWLSYGIALYELARYPEAQAALRRAARLCPPEKLHLVQHHFGHLYRQKGAFSLAERWYRKAIALQPGSATGYIYLGALLAVGGRLREAGAIHRKATQCETGSIDEAYLNLGYVLRAQDQFADAAECFRRALKIDPKYKEAKDALADVERLIGTKSPKTKPKK
jgi:tetratricopeptide (TPR) repeat protein